MKQTNICRLSGDIKIHRNEQTANASIVTIILHQCIVGWHVQTVRVLLLAGKKYRSGRC